MKKKLEQIKTWTKENKELFIGFGLTGLGLAGMGVIGYGIGHVDGVREGLKNGIKQGVELGYRECEQNMLTALCVNAASEKDHIAKIDMKEVFDLTKSVKEA